MASRKNTAAVLDAILSAVPTTSKKAANKKSSSGPVIDREELHAYLEAADPMESTEVIQGLTECLDQLTEQGQADFVLLRNEPLRQWWQEVQNIRRQFAQRHKAVAKVQEFWNSLSPDERKSLEILREDDY